MIPVFCVKKVEKPVKKTVEKSLRTGRKPEKNRDLFSHFKSDAPHGFDVIFAALFPELSPEMADMRLKGAFRAVGSVFADPVEELRFRHNLRRILHQKF